jgi:hypothetical protein
MKRRARRVTIAATVLGVAVLALRCNRGEKGTHGERSIAQLVSELRTEPSGSWEIAYGSAGRELIGRGEEAVPALVPLLAETPAVAEKAAEVLAEMGAPAIRRMAEFLKTEENEKVLTGILDVCARAARSVTQLEDRVARHLGSRSVEVRRRAARFFRDIRPAGREVIQALQKAKNDPDELTRSYVEKSLKGPDE